MTTSSTAHPYLREPIQLHQEWYLFDELGFWVSPIPSNRDILTQKTNELEKLHKTVLLRLLDLWSKVTKKKRVEIIQYVGSSLKNTLLLIRADFPINYHWFNHPVDSLIKEIENDFHRLQNDQWLKLRMTHWVAQEFIKKYEDIHHATRVAIKQAADITY